MVSPVIKVVPGELASDGLQVILDLLSGPVQRQSILNGIGFGNPVVPEKIIKVTVLARCHPYLGVRFRN